jgi:CopG family transcriptional regulator/antitoxin EndoAI
MVRTTKTVTLSLPPEMVDKIDELMKEEGRTRSELLREALRRYAEEQEMKKIYRYGEIKAREKGITEDQIEDMIDARRK